MRTPDALPPLKPKPRDPDRALFIGLAIYLLAVLVVFIGLLVHFGAAL